MKVSHLLVFFQLFLISVTKAEGETKTLSNFWKITAGSESLDPSKWNAAFKTRLFLTALVFCAAQYLKLKMMLSLALTILTFGAVHLTTSLALSLMALVYGYKRKNPLFLGAGALSSYLYFLGSDLTVLQL